MRIRYYHMKDPSYHEISIMAEAAWKTKQVKTYYGKRDGLTNPPAWQRLTAITVCEISAADDEFLRTPYDANARVVTGYAFCSSRDNFCRAKGRKIALGRAARQLGMTPTAVLGKVIDRMVRGFSVKNNE